MAKRFTDTGKWAKGSFMELEPRFKLAWIYLCDCCDHAGVWDVNLKLMSVQTGEDFDLASLLEGLGGRIQLVSPTKIFIPDFVEFQYGTLNSTNRVHLSVLQRLEKVVSHKPLVSPLQGAKDKDKDTDKEKDKDQEKEKERAATQRDSGADPAFLGEVQVACEAFRETLRHFGQGRSLLEAERFAIARAIKQHGAKAVRLALVGARYQPRDEKFNPGDWVDLQRWLDSRHFSRLLGYGVKQVQAGAVS